MAIKLDIDMPKMCCDCPCFEPNVIDGKYRAWMGVPLGGHCKALPIKNLDGTIVDWQPVSKREEIEKEVRNEHCPLKECK